jgi:hypothetical protein
MIKVEHEVLWREWKLMYFYLRMLRVVSGLGEEK